MKDRVLDAYAKLAKDYENNVDTESIAGAYYERPAMMNLLPHNMEKLAVLDAGCAAGWYSEQFLNLGADVTAIDLSPEMVEATRKRLGDKAKVMRHDLSEPLPFNDESFDLIVSSLTLHYIEDWELTFQEFQRVLKPGGQFVFSVHHPFMDFTSFKRPDYFTQELLEEEWNKKEAGRVKVVFYRRPLQSIINVTAKYFTLKQIIEPQPIMEFKEKSPDWYEHLSRNPHFLIIEATSVKG
jgi:ubiquinone/menaquinone biosynthesis C-methylase UbiE